MDEAERRRRGISSSARRLFRLAAESCSQIDAPESCWSCTRLMVETGSNGRAAEFRSNDSAFSRKCGASYCQCPPTGSHIPFDFQRTAFLRVPGTVNLGGGRSKLWTSSMLRSMNNAHDRDELAKSQIKGQIMEWWGSSFAGG